MATAMDDPELIRTLTRIEAKLDHLAETYTSHLTDHADHETRIRSLEKRVWAIPSMAVIIAIASAIMTFIH